MGLANKSVPFVAVPFVADVEKNMENTKKITIFDLALGFNQSVLCERIAEKYGVTVVGMQLAPDGKSAIASVVAPQTNRMRMVELEEFEELEELAPTINYKSLMA